MSNDEFTASNGLTIRHNIDTGYFEAKNEPFGIWSHVKPLTTGTRSMIAMQEYFQAKRDKELGRWRDPEHPHIFAKGSGLGIDWVGVVKENEEGLAYGQFRRGERVTLDPMSVVASRYFDAHPTPKPWHDAEQNELWELTIRGNIPAPEVYRFAQDTTCADSKVFRPVNNPQRVWFDARDKRIESARRIWPDSEETTND